MSFIETQFPVSISLGATGGPAFSTDVIETYGGHEQRNANWSQARGRWNVATGIKTASDMADFLAFFRARQGRAYGFRFKDWTDYTVTGGNIGIGDDNTTTFPLRKQYMSGSTIINRTITKPVAGSYIIYVNGVVQTETTDYSLNLTTGIVNFVTPPSNGQSITASFEFDVPVRFDSDDMQINAVTHNLQTWQDIAVIEIRV